MQKNAPTQLSQIAQGCQFSAGAVRGGSNMATLAQSKKMAHNFQHYARPPMAAHLNRAPKSRLEHFADRAMAPHPQPRLAA